MKKSAIGTRRSPPGPAMTASASSASSGGAMSADGAALQRLPPSVARLRTWTSRPAPRSPRARDSRRAAPGVQLELPRGHRGADAEAAAVLDLRAARATPDRSTTTAGLEDPVLHLGQEVGAAGHQLGLAPPLGEDLQAVVDAVRQGELESSHGVSWGMGGFAMIHRVRRAGGEYTTLTMLHGACMLPVA